MRPPRPRRPRRRKVPSASPIRSRKMCDLTSAGRPARKGFCVVSSGSHFRNPSRPILRCIVARLTPSAWPPPRHCRRIWRAPGHHAALCLVQRFGVVAALQDAGGGQGLVDPGVGDAAGQAGGMGGAHHHVVRIHRQQRAGAQSASGASTIRAAGKAWRKCRASIRRAASQTAEAIRRASSSVRSLRQGRDVEGGGELAAMVVDRGHGTGEAGVAGEEMLVPVDGQCTVFSQGRCRCRWCPRSPRSRPRRATGPRRGRWCRPRTRRGGPPGRRGDR